MPSKTNTQPFYSRAYLYFGVAFLIMLFGFLPSYFLKLGETSAAHHFHGITASLWMLLLVVQPLLYSRNKMKWHRMLGRTSFILVPLLIIGGLYMIHIMMNKGNYPPLVPYQLGFIDFFTLSQFALFYILAIKNISSTQYHARYMACTIFGPLIPAITRLLFWIPGVSSFSVSLNLSYVIVEVVLVLLILDDKRRGKIRLPYPLMLGLLVVQHVIMNYIGEWAWWQEFMNSYAEIAL
jgi:hypothetical protein